MNAALINAQQHCEVEAVEVIINFEKALLISFNYNATSQQLTLIYGFPGNLDTFEKTLHPYYPQFNRVYKEIIKCSNLINLDATYQERSSSSCQQLLSPITFSDNLKQTTNGIAKVNNKKSRPKIMKNQANFSQKLILVQSPKSLLSDSGHAIVMNSLIWGNVNHSFDFQFSREGFQCILRAENRVLSVAEGLTRDQAKR